eukprot:gene21838-27909_t
MCYTEREIINSVTCIDSSKYKSILTSVFNTTSCEYFTTYDESVAAFGLNSNSLHVADNTPSDDPVSDILISYFEMGNCTHISGTDFGAKITDCEHGEVQTTYVSNQYLKEEFGDDISDALYYTGGSLVLTISFMVIGVRGIVISLTTLYCIFISFIHAAALLPYWTYSEFSSFNSMAVIIMCGIGAVNVMLYGSAWRRTIRGGTHATVAQIIESYSAVSQSIFYTTLAAMISLFSFLASPVIVISQLGAFLGMSVLVFYVMFHYVVIPMWIFCSWFPLDIRYHIWLRDRKEYWMVLFGLDKKPEEDHGGVYTTAAIADIEEPPAAETEEEEEAIVLPTENIRYDNWTNPNAPVPAPVVIPAASSEVDDVQISPAGGSRRGFLSSVFGRSETATSSPNISPTAASAATAPATSTAVTTTVAPAEQILSAQPVMVTAAGVVTTRGSVSGAQSVMGEGELVDEEALAENENPPPVVEQQPEEVLELEIHDSFWRGKRPLKMMGFGVLALVIVGLGIIYYLVTAKINVDFGIPQLFDPQSNIGEGFHIVKTYKNTLFSLQSDTVNTLDNQTPTYTPTQSPLGTARPTMIPTRPTARPSARPTNPTALPTFFPTLVSLFPTRFPTERPTMLPTTSLTYTPTSSPVAEVHVDYIVTGCYGIAGSKAFVDGDTNLQFNLGGFQGYARGRNDSAYGLGGHFFTNSSLLSDLSALCAYVDTHKDYLNIIPTWVRERDCIYDQLVAVGKLPYWRTSTHNLTVNNLLTYWAENNYVSGTMLGLLDADARVDFHEFVPVWTCANFTVRTYGVTSLIRDNALAIKMNKRWSAAFSTYGGAHAQAQGIPVTVGSTEYTLPILKQGTLDSIRTSIIASVFGFMGLLLCFTVGDFGLTFLGSLGIFAIMAMTLCIHVYLVPGNFDLLDLVVIVAILCLAVNFPSHLLIEYIYARFDHDEHNKQSAGVVDEYFSPALASTNSYIRFRLLVKCGEYVIILSLVSYIFTAIFLPYLMALGSRTKVCEALCYDPPEYDSDEEEEVQELGIRTLPEEEPLPEPVQQLVRRATEQRLVRGQSQYRGSSGGSVVGSRRGFEDEDDDDDDDYGDNETVYSDTRTVRTARSAREMHGSGARSVVSSANRSQRPMQRHGSSMNGDSRSEGASVADRERELIRLATMQSMSVPPPPVRNNTEAAEQELIRLATRQSMAEAAPPAPQQLMRAEHELVRIATQQSLAVHQQPVISSSRSVADSSYSGSQQQRPVSNGSSNFSSSSSVYSQEPHMRYADPRQHDPRMNDPRLRQQQHDPRYQADPRRQQGVPQTYQQQQQMMPPPPQYQQQYQQPQAHGYPPQQQGYPPQPQHYAPHPQQQQQQQQQYHGQQQAYVSPYDPRHNGRMPPGAVGSRLSPDQRFTPNMRYGQQPQYYDDQSDNQSQSQYSQR